ncbi:MAG: type III restriction-modification system endonuclease [Candidatus Loosdrechtia sp.]|uniref:type III restriction-modification system endonuclease n=1 Tax=Candidatus Loosdrechtia sp. TaxID=3101272 RepID=UPI003A78C2CC|nr:MAG: DEAD/DEAH box helicase family protein [Candidatus Jettenia sp. AMX2]
MKLKFKKQDFQTEAVNVVADCFTGQPKHILKYRIDPGKTADGKGPRQLSLSMESGFKNYELVLTPLQILENIQSVQRRQNLHVSSRLVSTSICPVNLDIEMETGTGKTYCYIKTMFELNERYGWSKFIVMVPSIPIREGVYKSFEITAGHFLEQYNKRIRFFIYNSKQLHHLEHFSSDGGINVIIINVQAFAARGKDARRIYLELDDFQSRRPIDVIKSNHPILVLDEPQKMEGTVTTRALEEFNPLAILRYSATHKTEYNKVYRLDALDAYHQKLVKKIAVRGITVKGFTGTNAYLYLESIQISTSKPPVARMEFEVRQKTGIKRVVRQLVNKDNLFDLSGELEQYRGFVITDIDAVKDTVSFTNGVVLEAGEASGDVNEATIRRIQIREAVKAHLEKEQSLFNRGIKVLSLFFIDEVAKYRRYENGAEQPGEYAIIFEEEYNTALNEILKSEETPYTQYLRNIKTNKTHNGYFSIDKKTKQMVDPTVSARSTETDDVDAYDLILKDKERLLSMNEPVRFVFSHSALSEGWDNPNVFVICALKYSDSTIRKRQEVGRGLRLCVNQDGDRMDSGTNVHDSNLLTVVAGESYKDFVSALQKEISESLSERPRKADKDYFTGKVIKTTEGDITITEKMANQICRYLIKNDYTDDNDAVTQAYHDSRKNNTLADLSEDLVPYAPQIIQLIDSVFSDASLPEIDDGRRVKPNPLNKNFEKAEFRALWKKINQKAAYTVHFDSDELKKKCVAALNKELKVTKLQYTIQRGEQRDSVTHNDLKAGAGFEVSESQTDHFSHSVHSGVKYDLIGKIAEDTKLTRATIAGILKDINESVFSQYRVNPEDFILKAGTLINEQKATVIVEYLAYDMVRDRHDLDIFTAEKPRDDFSKAMKTDHHIYDYVFTDSNNEKKFVTELDKSVEVVVYAKLPRSFFIPTPVGDYNPDWAIAFKEGTVKHIYFVAETKGSMSSMELRRIEECKIECARKFFAKITSDQVRYDVIDSYGKLMELVK